MANRREVISMIESIIRTTWPSQFSSAELHEDTLLGDGGLELDSVDIVEILYACEDACGIEMSTDLFEGPPLTIERVAQHFSDAG
jgi:acyl carrier protein